MVKAALVGALALAAVGVMAASADEIAISTQVSKTVSRVTFVITDAHIARLKAMLRLTPVQERYWPPVEAALRQFARQQAREDAAAAGFVQRLRDHAAAASAQTVGLKRVLSAAMPLIRALDEEQKQDALKLARALGFASLASAL